MLLKTIQISALAAAIGVLAGCTMNTDQNQNRFIQREVDAKKLPNGKTLLIGYRAPTVANQCTLLATHNSNYSMDRFKGQFGVHMGNTGYIYLQKQAVAYATKNPHVNYAYLYIPNMHSIDGININFTRKATIRYYACQTPPAVHHNL